jgi:hypothetical protein
MPKTAFAAALMLGATCVLAQWEPEHQISNSSSIAMTGLNNARNTCANNDVVNVVWMDNTHDDNDIMHSLSVDGGQSWSSPDRLTTDPTGAHCPSIACAGASVHLVWHDGRCHPEPEQIYYRRSGNGGADWEDEVRLSQSPSGATNPSVCAADGVVHAVFNDARVIAEQVFYMRSQDGGESWSEEMRLPADDSVTYGPSIAAQDTFVGVAWTGSIDSVHPGVFFKRSFDRGLTWGPDERLSPVTSQQQFPSVAIAGPDLYVTWSDTRDNLLLYEVYFRHSSDRGATWGPEIRLSEVDKALFSTVAATGSCVHVAWIDLRNLNQDVYYQRSTDRGATWLTEAYPLVSTTDWQGFPALACDGSRVHATWTDQRNRESEVYHRRDPNGSGLAEAPHAGHPGAPDPAVSIVCGVLELAPSTGDRRQVISQLRDISGRKVLDLKSGPNDVSRLAPGAYFVRSRPSAVDGQPSALRRVVVTR